MASAPLSDVGPPHGIDLVAYATLSADLAEGDRPPPAVLAAHNVTESQWTDASLFWTARMADDARERGAEARVADIYSTVFARVQDAKHPVAPLDVDGWAALTEEIDRAGGAAGALAARRLTQADWFRLVRHWARTLGADPALAERFDAARDAWNRAHGE